MIAKIMQASQKTKRDYVTRIIQEAQSWMIDQKWFSAQQIVEFRTKHELTPGKIAEYIQKFAVGPYKAGKLPSYIKAEIIRTRAYLKKRADLSRDATDKQRFSHLAQLPVSNQQVYEFAAFLEKIIKVLLL